MEIETKTNLAKTNTDFLATFYTATGKLNFSTPFAREILLLECYIAGTTYRENIAEIAETLKAGATLSLQREPENKFDPSAIAVYDSENNILGYVPRAKNEVLARLLEAGKHLSAKLIAKDTLDDWTRLNIEIFLHD